MPETLLRHLIALTDQCASIALARRARTRHTHLRRRLARINLPLQSVVHRVRRRLVLCDEAEFERHVRAVLARFRSDVLVLVRSLDNRARTAEVLALLTACEA
jgi:hypothetical protein